MSKFFKISAAFTTAVLFAVLSLEPPRVVAQSNSPMTGSSPSALQDDESTRCTDSSYGSAVACTAAIEGSWLFSISQLHSSSVLFNAVSSFAGGGVFVATGSKDRVNPASPLYGTWKDIGHHRYNSTTYFFIFDPAHPNGEAVATLRADQVFQLLDRNTLVGAGSLSICNLAGQKCTSVPDSDTQIRGSRMQVGNPATLIGELPTN